MKISNEYLQPTYFLDSDSETVKNIADKVTKNLETDIDKAKALFYWTRDKILYDPAQASTRKKNYKASYIIDKKRGWCVQKAVVLGALARASNIPSRLGFADIRNYQITEKLMKLMNTDLFIFHGFTELYLNGKWIKATPAFNIEICEKFQQKPVDFNGYDHAILPAETTNGEKHIEYIMDRGTYPDLPLKKIFSVMSEYYDFF